MIKRKILSIIYLVACKDFLWHAMIKNINNRGRGQGYLIMRSGVGAEGRGLFKKVSGWKIEPSSVTTT